MPGQETHKVSNFEFVNFEQKMSLEQVNSLPSFNLKYVQSSQQAEKVCRNKCIESVN